MTRCHCGQFPDVCVRYGHAAPGTAVIVNLSDQIAQGIVASRVVDTAREAVALRLVGPLAEAIDMLPDDVRADVDVTALADDVWAQVVDIAMERDPRWHPRPAYSPSADTRRMVARLLAHQAAEPDPFKGFPQ